MLDDDWDDDDVGFSLLETRLVGIDERGCCSPKSRPDLCAKDSKSQVDGRACDGTEIVEYRTDGSSQERESRVSVET